jgi:hypothetical protein
MLCEADRREARALLVKGAYRPQAGLPEGIDKRTTAAAGEKKDSIRFLCYSLPDGIS